MIMIMIIIVGSKKKCIQTKLIHYSGNLYKNSISEARCAHHISSKLLYLYIYNIIHSLLLVFFLCSIFWMSAFVWWELNFSYCILYCRRIWSKCEREGNALRERYIYINRYDLRYRNQNKRHIMMTLRENNEKKRANTKRKSKSKIKIKIGLTYGYIFHQIFVFEQNTRNGQNNIHIIFWWSPFALYLSIDGAAHRTLWSYAGDARLIDWNANGTNGIIIMWEKQLMSL